jgi:DNA-3-methyladenine glycosylase
MYWQFNISTSFEGRPECVLIRALEPVDISFPQTRGGLRRGADDIKQHFLFNLPSQLRREKLGVLSKPKLKVIPNGPGKLCQYLKIDKSFYGEDLIKSKKIWLADDGCKIKKRDIISAKRIGIDYAQEWARKPWRFYLKDNPFVSKR